MSEQVERRIYEMLGEPTESPYGNPIPGLEEIGGPVSPDFMQGVANLPAVVPAEGTLSAIIRRLGEPIQVDPAMLQQLQDAGILPGATVELASDPGGVRLVVQGAAPIVLRAEIAAHIFVAI